MPTCRRMRVAPDGAPRPRRRAVSRDQVFRPEHGWGCPATGPATGRLTTFGCGHQAAL